MRKIQPKHQLSKTSDKRIFLFLLVVYFAFQATIISFFLRLPSPLDALWLQLTYSQGTFRSIVDGWSSEQLRTYLNHYYLDFLHPLIYGRLLFSFLTTTVPVSRRALSFLPVLGAVADEVENICDLYLILNLDNFSNLLQWLGATASWLKWISLFFTIVACTWFICIGLYKKVLHYKST